VLALQSATSVYRRIILGSGPLVKLFGASKSDFVMAEYLPVTGVPVRHAGRKKPELR
jgi:hypothetical protein